MRVGIVLHGDAPSDDDMLLLDDCDHVICADGGAKPLLRTQRTPDLIIGDLDSLDADAFKWADALGIAVERYPENKDVTDGELALSRALALGPSEVVVLGGFGGRFDHVLGSLALMRRLAHAGVPATMVGHGQTVEVLREGDRRKWNNMRGVGLSLIVLEGEASVTLTGTKWTLERGALDALTCRGLSNVVEEKAAALTVHQGIVVACLTHNWAG